MSFATETAVKAVRKRHRCDGCGKGDKCGGWHGHITNGEVRP